MRFRRPVTPAEVGAPLVSLCAEVCPGAQPIYVDVRPIQGAPINDCFSLVASMVAQQGGDAVLGWTLREMPGLFVEAEFHSVWRKPTGEFVDVAPKAEATQRILFLPDHAARYKGVQVNNVRRPVTRDSETEEYLAMFDQLFELLNRGERAEQHGEIQLTGAEAAEYDRMADKMAFMHSRISNRFPYFGPYTACWCGSGKKMKWCHKTVLPDA
jgi:hypothetical protein